MKLVETPGAGVSYNNEPSQGLWWLWRRQGGGGGDGWLVLVLVMLIVDVRR